jgi:nitrous oxidase accessory protein NosD
MKTTIKVTVCIILSAVLALEAGSAQALEPELAGANLIVDDDGQQCPTAGYSTIGEALNRVEPGSTITVCAGTYAETLVIDSKPGLKLIGKDMPRIIPPRYYYAGSLISVWDSSNVVIQGLIVDGNYAFQPGSTNMTGIWFHDSSGTISQNIISHMRRSALDTSPYGIGIRLSSNPRTSLFTVKILSNTITDFQYAGISVSGNYKPIISRNLIQTISGPNDPSGILLDELAGGTISGNVITNNYGFEPGILNTGIKLVNTSNVKVTSNTITGSRTGVYLQGALLTAEANSISGNQILDCGTGVLIDTSAGGRANNNSIKGNKMISTLHYSLSTAGVRLDGAAAGNRITGNTIEGYFAGPVQDGGANTVVSGNKWKPFAAPGA